MAAAAPLPLAPTAGPQWTAYRDALRAFQADPTQDGAAAVVSTHRAFLDAFLPDEPAEALRQRGELRRRLDEVLKERAAA